MTPPDMASKMTIDAPLALDRRVIDLHPDVVGRHEARDGDRRRTTASVLRRGRRADRELQQYEAVLQRMTLAQQLRPAPVGMGGAGAPAPPRQAGRSTGQKQNVQRTAPRMLPCPACGESFPGPWLVRHLGSTHPGWQG